MKNVTCHCCTAENPADYTFCFHCKAEPKTATRARKIDPAPVARSAKQSTTGNRKRRKG